ncbi:MAG: DUF882 domain-containing protein [Prevotella sp.]|nr:DUF882 domain-containing protein [Prevotella sp.]
MEKVMLSEHFSLKELTKTKYKLDNTPTVEATANLKNICENWLEDLRYSYNRLYVLVADEDYSTSENTEGIVINCGYRSKEVNKAAAGVWNSNHLTGCAVDIRACGPDQALRYMNILLDISDGTSRLFDEMILERQKGIYWVHFAVRPKNNRRKIGFILK